MTSAMMASQAQAVSQTSLWRYVAFFWSVAIALGVVYFQLGIPLQLSDCLLLLVDAQRAGSVWDVIHGRLDSHGFLRPAFWAQIKILFDLAHGYYFLVFKAFHALQVLLLSVLFVRVLPIRSACDVAAAMLAGCVLFGSHAFLWTVWEGYPVNHYLEIVLACVIAVNLLMSDGGRRQDVLAVVVFVLALLILESGVVVLACLVAGALLGCRGVSRRAVACCLFILTAYVWWRFVSTPVGLPDLGERSSGFWLGRLEPQELQRRFGAFPLPYYAYNVMASALTVLFSEPRDGQFLFLRHVVDGRMRPWLVISAISSLLMTAGIGWYLFARIRGWRRRGLEDEDRIAVIAAAALLANAVVSYPYTKDAVMSPAAALYAIVAYFACRHAAARIAVFTRPAASLLLATVVLACSVTWTMRAAGTFYNMREMAYMQRGDWALSERVLSASDLAALPPAGRELFKRLQADAIEMRVPNPNLDRYQMDKWVDQRH